MIYIMCAMIVFGIIAAILAVRVLGYKIMAPLTAYIAVASVVVCCLGGWASYAVTHHLAQRGAIGGYHQFFNGTIVSTKVDKTTCREDGACVHTYDCDPYVVLVPVTTVDAKGNSQTTYVPETRYRSCPYATEEYTYTLTNSFGGVHVIASHIFSDAPREWRRGTRLPSSVERGVPKEWTRADEGLKRGDPVPVTVRKDYDNYILSSESTILRSSSGDIETLKKEKLLPDHTQNLKNPIYDDLNAKKMSFVGFSPANGDAWQDALMRFNAGLGMERQGDLHVVAIKASRIPSSVSADDYLMALKAYWLNDLGKNAIAKNGIILVIAVDDSGQKIKWSRAATGMPIGNGSMVQALNLRLSDQPFSINAVFGQTKAIVKGNKASYVYGDAVVPQTIMVDFPFKRACMACTDKDEAQQNGFVNLSTEIKPSGWSIFWTIIVDMVIVAVLTTFLVFGYVSYMDSNSSLRRKNTWNF